MFKRIFLVCFIAIVGLTNQTEGYNDKTSTVSKSYDSMGGWKSSCAKGSYSYCGRKGLASGYVSVNHRVGMTSGGYNVSVGSPINFSYNPDDPFFVVTGNGSIDTPYGKWVGALNDRIDRAFIKSNGYYFNDALLRRYIYWVAEKPMVSMSSSNPSVINCSGMNCSATGQGIATLTANINTTQAREWAVVINSNEFLLSYDGTVTDTTGYVDASTDWDDNDILPLPSTSMSWTVTVTAPTPINGSCGTRDTTYPSATTAWPGGSTLCSSGSASPASLAFPASGATVNWQCSGSNGGTTASCSASRLGTPVNGVCGTRNTVYPSTTTTWPGGSTLCSAGTASPANPSFPLAGSSTVWSCNGINGGTSASCTATRQSSAVNGVCGTRNTNYPVSTTTWPGGSTLCSAGTASPVNPSFPAINSTSNWQCHGSGGGTDANCTASRASKPASTTLEEARP